MPRPEFPAHLLPAARQIRALVLDVDGVLSDGTIYMSAQGDEIKAFNILDGQGILQLQRAGLTVAIITGRNSPLTTRRAADLGIAHLIQGREDKLVALADLAQTLHIDLAQIAYVGDDLPDLSAIQAVGLGITVPNAHWHILETAAWCTHAAGGYGAIREVCDALLQAQGLMDKTLAWFSQIGTQTGTQTDAQVDPR